MSTCISIKKRETHSLLVVEEDKLDFYGVADDVLDFIENYPDPLRIEVMLSRNALYRFTNFITTLNRVDYCAQEKFIPVQIKVCPCCKNDLKAVIKTTRWRSRWDVR